LEKKIEYAENRMVRAGLKSVATRLTPELLKQDPDLRAHVTVCSFSLSADGDLLSQWQGYCPKGGGYALGFSGPMLARALGSGWSMQKCLYEKSEQEALLAPLIEWTVSEAPTGPGLLESFWPRFLRLAPLIKDQAFKAEQEWRIVPLEKLQVNRLSF